MFKRMESWINSSQASLAMHKPKRGGGRIPVTANIFFQPFGTKLSSCYAEYLSDLLAFTSSIRKNFACRKLHRSVGKGLTFINNLAAARAFSFTVIICKIDGYN